MFNPSKYLGDLHQEIIQPAQINIFQECSYNTG